MPESEVPEPLTRRVYTIQLKATINQLDVSSAFKGIEGVKEIIGEDGLFKYVYGEYQTFAQAKAAIDKFISSGYPDAFVREINVRVK